MAMASANVLEDYVHCHMCYELFQSPEHEPLMLQCLHSLCEECVDKLSCNNKKHKVKCPLCNMCTEVEDITSDFRAKSLVDDYLKQQDKDNIKPMTVTKTQECCVCKCVGKDLISQCLDCDVAVCIDCEKAHRGGASSSPANHSHGGADSPGNSSLKSPTPPQSETMLGDSLIKLRRRERCHSWHQVFEDPSGKSILAVPHAMAMLQIQSNMVTGDSNLSLDRHSENDSTSEAGVDVNYQNFLKFTFKVSTMECIPVKGKLKRLRLVGDKLWYTTDEAIQVFAKDGQAMETIKVKSCKGHVMSAIPIDQDRIAVACWENKGLLMINLQGKTKYTICAGSFSDVTLYNDKIYALRKDPCSLVICKEKKGKWQKFKHFQISLYNLEYDTLCVENHKMYICSWFNDCLCQYNKVGDLVAQYSNSKADSSSDSRKESLTPSILYDPGFEPRLCCVDRHRNAMIADCEKGRIQICSSAGVWQTMEFGENLGIGNPRDAVTDSMDHLWIVSYFPKDRKSMYSCGYPYLLKCTKQRV